MNGRQPVIFCDFDGTITVNDNIVAIMKHFHPPGWDDLVRDILNQTISIQEGVGRMFTLLPSSRREEIVKYAIDNIRIRAGFADLLAYCREKDIEFLVTSGGIDFFVYPTLAAYGISRDKIYCNGSDFSEEMIRIVWPHPCDDDCAGGCGMCKTSIIRAYQQERYYRILIGDSITDFAGALLADAVFARSHLLDRYRELNLPHYAYEDFYDVIGDLKTMEGRPSERR